MTLDTEDQEVLSDSAKLLLESLDACLRKGNGLFLDRPPELYEWAIVLEVLKNDAAGRLTVAKHLVEATGKSDNTIRSAIERFLASNLVMPVQMIGRSVLYAPTAELKARLNAIADKRPPEQNADRK